MHSPPAASQTSLAARTTTAEFTASRTGLTALLMSSAAGPPPACSREETEEEDLRAGNHLLRLVDEVSGQQQMFSFSAFRCLSLPFAAVPRC